MIGLPSWRREKWTSTEMDGSGVNFVRCLVESLWYIDSHHHIFEKQRCSIPAITKYFTGYNACEASKQSIQSSTKHNLWCLHLLLHSLVIYRVALERFF